MASSTLSNGAAIAEKNWVFHECRRETYGAALRIMRENLQEYDVYLLLIAIRVLS